MIGVTKEQLISFETTIKGLWETGQIRCPVHLSGGNEDQLIEIFKEVKDDDYVFATHRNHYHYLLKHGDSNGLRDEIMGMETGISRGHGRSMCYADHSRHFYCSAIVAGICAIAVGTAWAVKEVGKITQIKPFKKICPVCKGSSMVTSMAGTYTCGACENGYIFTTPHVWCFIGDGAVDNGHFWEAIQYAEGWNLPITFILEDNNRSTCTTQQDRLGRGCLDDDTIRWKFGDSIKVRIYSYIPTYPHVGSGKYVQF